MYSSLPGAVFKNVTSTGPVAWVVDCTAEINLSFTFSGVEYPIHPLDATAPLTNDLSDGCIGMWQPVGVDSGSIPDTLDMILGMAFCKPGHLVSLSAEAHVSSVRNTYTLINMGDFVDGQFMSTAQPFIQLLSTTNDSTKAHNEFLAARKPTSGKKSSATQHKIGLIHSIAVILAVVVLSL